MRTQGPAAEVNGLTVARASLGVVPVPLDRPPQALLEIDLRLPAGGLAQLRGVHVLAVDLALRVPRPADVGLEVAAREPDHQGDDLADRVRLPAAGVVRLAADLVAVERVGD